MPLIELTQGYDLVFQWFNKLISQGHYVCGYVIMPNHVHVLIGFRNVRLSINSVVGNGKRYLAYQIIDRLEMNNEIEILMRMQMGVSRSDRERGKQHEVWESSFDWKECNTERLITQKLEYIHDNPCCGKWNLVDSPVDYKYSSARFYIEGEHSGFKVMHFQELDDIDLTK